MKKYFVLIFVLFELFVNVYGNRKNETNGVLKGGKSPVGGNDCQGCGYRTYKSGRSCDWCSPGSFQPYDCHYYSSCYDCPVGFYQPYYGGFSCYICGFDTYTDKNGSVSCQQCDSSCVRIYTTDKFNTYWLSLCYYKTGRCYGCGNGKYVNGKICSPCPKGKYYYSENNINTDSSCSTCSDNYYQDQEGSISCKKCDSNCVVPCNKTTGYCPKCKPGYQSISYYCDLCSAGTYSDQSQNGKCMKCPIGTYTNQDGQLECINCPPTQYTTSEGSTTCFDCPSTCVNSFCESTTGKCLNCIGGYYKDSNDDCQLCSKGYYSKDNDNKCTKCEAGFISSVEGSISCSECPSLTYSNEERTQCLSCPSNCNVCDKTNGICSKCESGYGLNNKTNTCSICEAGSYSDGSKECESCLDGYYSSEKSNICLKCDDVCKTCDSKTGKCLTCNPGSGYNSESSGQTCVKCEENYYSKGNKDSCKHCSTNNCGEYCNVETGECSDCPDGKQLITSENNENKCISCSDNGNCIQCSNEVSSESQSETSRTCIKCKEGYYLDENECENCTNIPNCQTCSQTSYECIHCDEWYISTPLNETKCTKCLENEIKISDTECKKCSDEFQHCLSCKLKGTTFTEGYKCVECYPPYQLNEGRCEECLYGYDEINKICIQQTEECLRFVNSTYCIECQKGYVLREGKCYKIEGECSKSTLKSCERCQSGNSLTLLNDCTNEYSNCLYSNDERCLICNQYELVDNKCLSDKSNNCEYYKDNQCYISTNGYYQQSSTSSIKSCSNSQLCIENNGTEIPISCLDNYYLPLESNTCQEMNTEDGCNEINNSYCKNCTSNKFLKNGECVLNDNNCLMEQGGICLKCNSITVNSKGQCIDKLQIYCQSFNDNDKCITCEERRYRDIEGCIEKENSIYKNCSRINYENKGCNECEEGYYLDNVINLFL